MRNAKIDTLLLWRLWHSNASPDEICRQVGVSYSRLRGLAARFGLRGHERLKKRPRLGKEMPAPTPEQIEERAAEIRARWSPAERARRSLSGGRVEACIKKFAMNRRDYAFSAIDH